MRRCSSLPFVKKDDLDEAMDIFNKRAENLENEDLQEFSYRLIEYLNSQWRQGVFAVQDWNLYNLNLLLVPTTNNGNEGQNRRFKENFGVHPKIWEFFLILDKELEGRNADIPLILFGSETPPEDENYHSLKVEREITKANYEAGLLSLDSYMGKMGALSIKAGKAKTNDDDEDFKIPKKKPVKKPNVAGQNRPGNRGRRPVFANRPQHTSSSEQSVTGPASNSASELIHDIPARVATSPPAPTNGNLPWPSPTGIVPPPPSLPSTACRTTKSAAPPAVSGPVRRAPLVEIAPLSNSNDSLIAHIAKNNLGLKQRPAIPGDGNCWYTAIVDLTKSLCMVGPSTPNQLRLAVTNAIMSHPNKRQWIRSLFGGKARAFNKFVKEQSKDGVFVDNYSIAVTVTAEVLDVQFHIVGTSNDEKTPVTTIGEPAGGKKILHVGYYQDTSDIAVPGSSAYKAGHYQSLEAIGERVPRCCQASTSGSFSSSALDISSSPLPENEMVSKILSEEKILSLLKNDSDIVASSLNRLTELTSVSLEEIMKTKICEILFIEIRPLYSVGTAVGKKCRRLLKKYQGLCKSHPDFNDDDLPDVTDVEDEDDDTPQQPNINFRSLFTGNRRDSVIISRMAPAAVAPLESNTVPVSSSTMLMGTSVGLQSELLVPSDTLSTTSDLSTSKKRKSPPMSSVFFETESLLIPPPKKRGRGRPPVVQVSGESSLTCVTSPPSSRASPPARRGRGRPPKNVQEIDDTVEMEESSEEIVTSDSVILTPPPPGTPSPPKRRPGRYLVAPEPPQKRRPGRPPKSKDCSNFVETEISRESSVVLTPPPPTPPPAKRRPGRPRKIGN